MQRWLAQWSLSLPGVFQGELDDNGISGQRNWLPVVPCVSSMGRDLLITMVGDLSNGSYLRSQWDLFLGVVLYLFGFFTHIHLFGLDPSVKVWNVGFLVLNPSSNSSPHKESRILKFVWYWNLFQINYKWIFLYVFFTLRPMRYMIELDSA